MKKILFALLLLPAVFFTACSDDDDKGGKPLPLEAINSYIEANYAGAVIQSMERDAKDLVDVDILHDGIRKDVYFSMGGQWIYTDWDVLKSALPQAVIDAVENAYPNYVFGNDDVDYVQTPAGDYYRIEIEKGNFEKHLKVALDGSSVEEI